MIRSRPAVLIVDDVESNLLALEAILARLECEPVRASSGNEALRLLLQQEFAVMLLDVQMPEMDGFEVARYARANTATRDVPIVFITAMHETEENLLQGYGSGAIDFLFKPIKPEVLCSKVQVFLELHQSRSRLKDEIDAHKETMRELEAFNYSVSHDLRAPLTTISGFASLLLEDYGDKLDDEGRKYLGHITAKVRAMADLIEDLLRLSRAGRGALESKPVDLVPVVRSIVEELRSSDPDRAVELVTVERAPTDADPSLIHLVLSNLIRNAWKFTRKEANARIEFGVLQDRDQLVYFVRDNGAGFDPQQADKLFEAFSRLHRSEQFEGNGIGLTIVQRVVRRHAGNVWAESKPGQGATFYFTLRDRYLRP